MNDCIKSFWLVLTAVVSCQSLTSSWFILSDLVCPHSDHSFVNQLIGCFILFSLTDKFEGRNGSGNEIIRKRYSWKTGYNSIIAKAAGWYQTYQLGNVQKTSGKDRIEYWFLFAKKSNKIVVTDLQ